MNVRIKAFTVLSLIFFLSPFSAYGCLNPVGQSFVGQMIKIEGISANDFVKNLITHKDRAYWENIRKEIFEQQKEDSFLKTVSYASNNLAVALVHLGQNKEAIEILEKSEKNNPGNYATATNLGTAYELNGENHKALEWIKEAVDRNKKSHQGTEWLHVKILEAKIAMEKDADWIKTHSVLGVDFDANPQALPTDHLGQEKTLNEVEEALIYQLHERLEFVKPPEPIVADLLAALSKVFALKRTAEHASALKDLSIKYGAEPEETKVGSPESENQDVTNNYFIYGTFGTILVFSILLIYFLAKRKKYPLD